MTIGIELWIILLLTLLNGVFAGSEIAILTVRKTRLRELADQGNRAARALIFLRDHPERFIATVQIVITVVSASAAAFGGARLAHALTLVLERLGVGQLREDLALALVIGLISYLSLVLGELVPKSLGLRYAERYSLLVSPILYGLSWVVRPLVWFLTVSSNAVLRVFHDRTTFTEARLSKEELQQLVDEAATAGTLERGASEIASRALVFGDVRVSALMVPRNDMVTLSSKATREDVRQLLVTHGHTRIPVHDRSKDAVVGYVTARDLIALLAKDDGRAVRDVVRKSMFVPENALAADVLKDMQRKRDHLAMVIDEQGDVLGLVTLEDLVEELVGEIFAEHETPVERIRREPDGRALVRGRVPVHEVNRELGIELPEGAGWVTIAGLVMVLAGGIPQPGMRLRATPSTMLEVVEASDRRVLAVRIANIRPKAKRSTST